MYYNTTNSTNVIGQMELSLLLLSTHSSLLVGGIPFLLFHGFFAASNLAGLLRRRDPSTNPGPTAWCVSVGN